MKLNWCTLLGRLAYRPPANRAKEPRSPAEGMPATFKSWNTTSLSSNTKESSTPMGTATVPNNSHCQSYLFQLTEILATILIPPSVERECPATSQPITTTCLQSTLCGNPHRNDLKARLHPHLTHAESAVAGSWILAANSGGSSTSGQLLHRQRSFSLSATVLYTPGTCFPHPAHEVFPHLLHATA